MNLCAFTPVFIAITYFFIYYLLPKTIMKRKYLLFITGFLLAYIIGTAINYFTAEMFLITTDFFSNTFQHRIEMSNYNTRWGMIIATLALGIKLTKNWYLQQQENLEIIRRKSKTEMQSEKARIHPELLMRSLETIYENIQLNNDMAPTLILNLSELLSYSLYENENVMVLLKTELLQLQNLVLLEQEKKGSAVCITMQIKGDAADNYIAPMVIVKTLEQIITLLYNAEIYSCFLQLNLTAENDMLFSTWSLENEDENAFAKIDWELFLANTQSRLNSYSAPQEFSVKLKEYQNEIVVKLQLNLSKQPHTAGLILNTTKMLHDNL